MAQLIEVALLSAHLLLVNVAMAGPLLCIWLEWRQSHRDDALAGRAGLQLARGVSWALLLGIATGFLLLALRWLRDGDFYTSSLLRMPHSRLWFGLGELVFSFACMGVYTSRWRRGRQGTLLHRALAAAAATNLLIHFPALFTIVSIVGTRPELAGQTLDRAAYQSLLFDGEVLSRVVHVWLSAAAVSAAAVMALALRLGQELPSAAIVRHSAAICLIAVLVQVPCGVWVTMEMPETARGTLMGGDLVTTVLFAVGIVAVLALLQGLAEIALGEVASRRIARSVAVLVVAFILMVATRCRLDHTARLSALTSPPLLDAPLAAAHTFSSFDP